MKSLRERKIKNEIPREEVSPINFTFGMDNVRVSDIETEFPVLIGNKFHRIVARVIPGNCELLIGAKLLERFETFFDIKRKLVRFGQHGHWQTIVLNEGRHMCIPLAPRTQYRDIHTD